MELKSSIQLKKSITVNTYEVIDTIEVGAIRPEIFSIIKLANDQGGTITEKDIAKELMIGNSIISTGMLRRCIELNLLDGNPSSATITETGRESLKNTLIPLPSHGRWKLHELREPIIETRGIIHAEKIDSNDEQVRITDQLLSMGNAGKFSLTPQPLRKSLFDGTLTFGIPEKNNNEWHGRRSQYSVELSLTWKNGETAKLEIHQSNPITKIATSHNIQISLNCIQGTNPNEWLIPYLLNLEKKLNQENVHTPPAAQHDQNFTAISRTFSNTTDNAKRSRIGAVRINIWSDLTLEHNSESLGNWDEISLVDIPIKPATTDDATKWLHWLQWDGITEYITGTQLEHMGRHLKETFPEHRSITPLSPAEMIKIVIEDAKHPKRRELITAYDLGLWS